MRSKNRYSYSFSGNEIALYEAHELPTSFYSLMNKWKKQAEQMTNEEVGWYSKSVSIDFTYQEKRYRLIAEDFFSEEKVDLMNAGKLNSGYYHAIIEKLQATIKKDLQEMGATDICCYGFLD